MQNKIDDGVIKFSYQLKMGATIDDGDHLTLEKWRSIFFRMNFIGEYPIEKIGFGNLSKRIAQDSFIVTGSQTGHFPHLKKEQYCKIISCDLQRMKVIAQGSVAPSSESLTHFAIYNSSSQVNFIFHIHHDNFWNFLKTNSSYPSTPDNVSYGTTEMASETTKIIQGNPFGIFAMGGHQGGIISFGRTAEEAGKIILDTYRISSNAISEIK